jgi:hypothetical protein
MSILSRLFLHSCLYHSISSTILVSPFVMCSLLENPSKRNIICWVYNIFLSFFSSQSPHFGSSQWRGYICNFMERKLYNFKHIFSKILFHNSIRFIKFTRCIIRVRPPLWSSGHSSWLQIQRSRVRFPSLPDFLNSSGSGMGSTQPREDNWGATWMEK